MTLGALLAILGVILAIYALAKPAQRKSIGLFVPLPIVIVGLSISTILLIPLEVLVQWEVYAPGWKFFLGTLAFLHPIAVTIWAVHSWHAARLTKLVEPKFKGFLLSCLRDREYDEAVRILTKNRGNLANTITPDTADLIFDQQFVKALISARSWLHLELLTSEAFLDTLSDYRRAVDQTIRELLAAHDSPLRAAALYEEGGDETIHWTDEENDLIHRTFFNPDWYHRCRVGYPLVIATWERIDSGELDDAYNRPDSRYGAMQGISRRSTCPVFLAEKTIAHALKKAIRANSGSIREIHNDAYNLLEIFRVIYQRSRYQPETWDEPFGYGDYPTPFGFLLNEILSDFCFIFEDAWSTQQHGQLPPSEILSPVISMWAHCVMRFTKDEGRVSPQFRRSAVMRLLEKALELRQAQVHLTDNLESRNAWTELYIHALKDVAQGVCSSDQRDYLRKVLDEMDVEIEHIFENRKWLQEQLGLNKSHVPAYNG